MHITMAEESLDYYRTFYLTGDERTNAIATSIAVRSKNEGFHLSGQMQYYGILEIILNAYSYLYDLPLLD